MEDHARPLSSAPQWLQQQLHQQGGSGSPVHDVPRLALPTDRAFLPLMGEILGLEAGIDCGAAGMPCPEPRPWGVQTCVRGRAQARPRAGVTGQVAGWTSSEGQEEHDWVQLP